MSRISRQHLLSRHDEIILVRKNENKNRPPAHGLVCFATCDTIVVNISSLDFDVFDIPQLLVEFHFNDETGHWMAKKCLQILYSIVFLPTKQVYDDQMKQYPNLDNAPPNMYLYKN